MLLKFFGALLNFVKFSQIFRTRFCQILNQNNANLSSRDVVYVERMLQRRVACALRVPEKHGPGASFYQIQHAIASCSALKVLTRERHVWGSK